MTCDSLASSKQRSPESTGRRLPACSYHTRRSPRNVYAGKHCRGDNRPRCPFDPGHPGRRPGAPPLRVAKSVWGIRARLAGHRGHQRPSLGLLGTSRIHAGRNARRDRGVIYRGTCGRRPAAASPTKGLGVIPRRCCGWIGAEFACRMPRRQVVLQPGTWLEHVAGGDHQAAAARLSARRPTGQRLRPPSAWAAGVFPIRHGHCG